MKTLCTVANDRLPSPGRSTLIRAQDKDIALFNVAGTFYAIDDSCPHGGASLAGGKLEGCTVQCAAHGLRFDLATGCMRYGPGVTVQSYPVVEQEGGVVITNPTI